MADDLLGLPTRDLLKKFGAGEHKPGSGSAAALLGLAACSLAQTVISLTSGRKGYESATVTLSQEERLTGIQDYLTWAFQQDSEDFDKVIQLRRERDDLIGTNAPQELRRVNDRLAAALWKSTDLPLDMNDRLLTLAEVAKLVFDLGFRSARGDSIVAMSAALAAGSGCLGIAYLNLQSTRDKQRTRSALARAETQSQQLSDLQSELKDAISQLEGEAHEESADY